MRDKYVLFVFSIFSYPFFHTTKKNGNEAFLAWRYRCTVRACLPEMRIFVRHVVALFCQYLGKIKGGGSVDEYSCEYQTMRWGSALFISPPFSPDASLPFSLTVSATLFLRY